jgi:hypothetical protein
MSNFNDDSLSDDMKFIPVPVAISRRSDSSQNWITFCPDIWPTLRFCTSDACYVVTLTDSQASPFRLVSGSQECVRDRCRLESNCVLKQCCFFSSPEYEQVMSRKRRVNDDVSQCIQSYCSGKLFRERILCIVKNCNRSA